MRLLVVQATDPQRVSTFRSMRVPVRLGHSVFQTGRLDPESIEKGVQAMRQFADAMEQAGVEGYRAVVTASARGAKNASELLDRVRDEAGITLSAVDGVEEARLVTLAVRTKMRLDGRALLMDLGGGSLELTEVDRGQTKHTVSLPIGTVRLLEAFLSDDGTPVTVKQDRLVMEYLDRMLEPQRKWLKRRAWTVVAGTGGNLEASADLCPVADPALGLPTIDVTAAREALVNLASMSPKKRGKEFGLKPDRADVIVPALYVITHVAKLAGATQIVAPNVGLKDGIVAELVAKHYRVWDYSRERDKLLASALQLGRRYHFDERHAMRVTAIALELFDGLKSLHGLGRKDREVLRLAALLHDVGDFVNPSGHHKHSQYIIENSEVMGLPPDERRTIALVARYHRKAHPSERHAAYRGLSEELQASVRKLAAILRVADAFDRGHRSKVEKVAVTHRKGVVHLRVHAEEDTSIEVWTAERKSDLMSEVFGVEVRVKVADG